MTDEQWNEIYKSAQETFSKIDFDNLTKQNFILAGASLAWLDHKMPSDNLHEEISDARKYIALFKQSGNVGYLKLAHDEAEHFHFLYDLAKDKPTELYAEYENILAEIEKLGYVPEPMNAISGIDFIPDSRIDELKIESLRLYIKFMEEKAKELTERSEIHGELAEKALADMLRIDVEIAGLLYQTADARERENLKEAFHKIGKAYKVM